MRETRTVARRGMDNVDCADMGLDWTGLRCLREMHATIGFNNCGDDDDDDDDVGNCPLPLTDQVGSNCRRLLHAQQIQMPPRLSPRSLGLTSMRSGVSTRIPNILSVSFDLILMAAALIQRKVDSTVTEHIVESSLKDNNVEDF